MLLLTPTTVPVKLGLLIGALVLIRALKLAVSAFDNFKFNAVCVAFDIGFKLSEVLSTNCSFKFVFALITFEAPVPPFSISITPEILFAVFE